MDDREHPAPTFRIFADPPHQSEILNELRHKRDLANSETQTYGYPNLESNAITEDVGRIDNIRNVNEFLLLSPTSKVPEESKTMVSLYRNKLDISELRKVINTSISELVPNLRESLEFVPRELLDDAKLTIEEQDAQIDNLYDQLADKIGELTAAMANNNASESQIVALEAQANSLRDQLQNVLNNPTSITVNIPDITIQGGTPAGSGSPIAPGPYPTSPAPSPSQGTPTPAPLPAPTPPTPVPTPGTGIEVVPGYDTPLTNPGTTPPISTDTIPTYDPNTPPDYSTPTQAQLPPFSNRLPDVSMIPNGVAYAPTDTPPYIYRDVLAVGQPDGLGWEYHGPGYPRIYEIGAGVRRIELNKDVAFNVDKILVAPHLGGVGSERPDVYPGVSTSVDGVSTYFYWQSGDLAARLTVRLNDPTSAEYKGITSGAELERIKRAIHPRGLAPYIYFDNASGFTGNPPVQLPHNTYVQNAGNPGPGGGPYAGATPTSPYQPWKDPNSQFYRWPVTWQAGALDEYNRAYWIIEQDNIRWTYKQ